MLETLPLLENTSFPDIYRDNLTTLQVNLGYLCNQQCTHCHVNASPKRTEKMDKRNIDYVLEFLSKSEVSLLDLTGGAPEMNPYFRYLVREARKMGVRVMDRCNLTILMEPGHEDLASFLAEQDVEITASLPCYQEGNVDKQRGKGVFTDSIEGLIKLNKLGYAIGENSKILNLVYNPSGPVLPPSQEILEADYKKQLGEKYGIQFNNLFTLANMPIQRFGSTLISKGQFVEYMSLLRSSHQDSNLPGVMCRSLISVDWKGYVYDCDFNQMLKLSLKWASKPKVHLSDIMAVDLKDSSIVVMDHCYGCTAGQGSSCGGALN